MSGRERIGYPLLSAKKVEENNVGNDEGKPFVADGTGRPDYQERESFFQWATVCSRIFPVLAASFCVIAATVMIYRRDAQELSGDGSSYREQTPANEHVPYKVYPPRNRTFPCYPHEKRSKYKEGMFFVKVPKTASSTIAGVGLRIAHRKGAQILAGGVCNAQTSHGDVIAKFHYDRRDRSRSFLWTFVRDPTRRTVSQFFYNRVSRRGEEPTDENFIKWARTGDKSSGNFQIDYVRLQDYGTNDEAVRDILNEYDFIGVTERLDESLAVLQILLGLDVGDALYLSAKAKQGGYVYVRGSGGSRCIYEEPSFVSPGMADYFASEEWRSHISGDALLYRAANYSLDRTIDQLGREKVASRLRDFCAALSLAQERCKDRAVFPCSEDGVLQEKAKNCYMMDKGCGYPCLDIVAKELAPGPG